MAAVKIIARHAEPLISRIAENDPTGDLDSLPVWIGWRLGRKLPLGASERACPRSPRNILTDGAAALTLREDFGDPNSYGFKVMTGPVSDPCISTAAGAAGCTCCAGSRL